MSYSRRESRVGVAVVYTEQPFGEVPLEVGASGAVIKGIL